MSKHTYPVIKAGTKAGAGRRRILGAALAAGFAGAGLPAWGQSGDYPTKAVTIVIPYPPGGLGDAACRRMAQRLSDIWKVPVPVENKPGAAGLLGFGRIAGAVAERVRPFGVNMIAHSPTTRAERFPADVARVDFDTLMRGSDIVCVFAESNPGTRGMVGERALSLMKPTAYLLNVARGDLLDEAAVERALRERRIAGAALDVSVVEPLPMDSPLRTLDNTILTPHLVGHTRELYEALAPAAIENIMRILRGELPLYCKNPQVEQRWRDRMLQLE